MVQLRECQQRGYEAMCREGSGIVKMFCGTGKTALFTRYICDKKPNLTVIVFPRIILMTQYLQDYVTDRVWKKDMPKQYIGICSNDETSGRGKTRFTTSAEDIREFLSADGAKLVTVTYQSLSTLIEVLEEDGVVPNLVIYDEAHHTTTDLAQEQVFESTLADADETFFFTATPTEEMYDDDRYGDVIYEYSHRQAVEDGVCKEFVVSIMLSTEPKRERHIYESIVRAAADTRNQRALVFHAFAEADKDGRTSVKDFRDQEPMLREAVADIVTERVENALCFNKVRCEAITAKTKNKSKILHEFEHSSDDTLFVLHNCSVIAEGVDTKSANMCVFADPRQSYVIITQNIGRITRVSGDNRPGCVLIPCYVDKAKYEAANGEAEKVDAIIREDMAQAGNFNAILNVLSALRQDDPEYFDMCLRYPHRYSPEEVMREFTRKGYTVVKTADTLGGLFDLDQAATPQQVADSLNKTLEIHTQNMEQPIEVYGANTKDDHILIVKDEDAACWKLMEPKTPAEKRDNVAAPKRPVQVKVHTNPDVKVLWNVVGTIEGKITTAFIDCEVVADFEQRAIEKALRFKEWVEKNGGRKPLYVLGSRYKTRKESATLEQKDEHNHAMWFGYMKRAKQGTSNSRIYLEVETILIGLFGERWYDNREQQALNKAMDFKQWVKEHDGRKPCLVLSGKKQEQIEVATSEQRDEHDHASWFNRMKESKKGRGNGNKLYPDVERILIELFGEQWFDNEDLEGQAIQKAMAFKEWVEAHNGCKPVLVLSGKTKQQRETATLEQKEEQGHASWFSDMKKVKNGNSRGKLYLDVERIFIELFGEEWYENDLEQQAKQKAQQLKAWVEANSGKKPQSIKIVNTSEKQEEHEWARWLGCMKDAKKGKGHSKLYPEVDIVLIELFGEQWYADLEQKAIQKAMDFKKWVEKNHGRKPSKVLNCKSKEYRSSASLEEKNEHAWAAWLGCMKKAKKGKGHNKLYLEVEHVLVELFGEGWYEIEDLKHQAIQKAMDFKKWVKEHDGMMPRQVLATKTQSQIESSTDKQKEEQKYAKWFSQMKIAKKGKGDMKLYPEVERILIDLFGNNWYENEKSGAPRKKSVATPTTPKTEESSTSAPRTLTDLEKYHQTFKRMRSANFTKRVQENRAEWQEYHRIADEHDARDPEERRPIHKIAKALAAVKAGKRAIDLGCGKNLLRTLAPHLRWTSVDAVAADETVIEADIAALPFEDETFSIVVLSRALWATNKEDVIREAMRVMADGGQMIVCEAFRKWWDADKNENILTKLLESCGCVIESTTGSTPDEGNEVFQYIICRKPSEVVHI